MGKAVNAGLTKFIRSIRHLNRKGFYAALLPGMMVAGGTIPAKAGGMQQIKVSDSVSYERILTRIYMDQLQPYEQAAAVVRLDSQVTADLKLLDTATGKYRDLNYSDHKRIGVDWLPALERMRRMTLVYALTGSRYYKQKFLFSAVNKALCFFCSYKPLPYCNNWYQQGITRPQTLALCLINLQMALRQHSGSRQGQRTVTGNGNVNVSRPGADLLPDSTWQLTVAAICKDTAIGSAGRNNPMHRYNAGANKSEIALGWIYIGALIHSGYMLNVGARELYLPLKYTTGEGIQYDRSFDMHYGYLYNGAYGAVLLRSVTEGAWYLRGTPYALTGEKLGFFSDFIRTSIFGQIRGGSMDWNILGRGISRYNATRPDFTAILKRLQIMDPAHKKSYEDSYLIVTGRKAAGYHIQPRFDHFWCTDFSVWRHPNFYMSLHGNSSRNHAQEIGNQENLKGYWGAEGVMDLMVTGKEYVNIFPVWNWKRLPGATLPDTLVLSKDKAPGEGDRKGTSDFCGGISDSVGGLSVYTIKGDLGLSAHKAWFMQGDRIYALGAGIKTDSTQLTPVSTTLNQCWYDSTGGVIISKGGYQTRINRDIDTVFTAATMPESISHGGVRYYFLPEKGYHDQLMMQNTTPVRLKIGYRSADWKGINPGNYPAVGGRVFELSLEHGAGVQDAAYSYALLPGYRKKRFSDYYMSVMRAVTVKNTDSIQAVFDWEPTRGGAVDMVAFYKPHVSYAYGEVRIEADVPCLVMLRRTKDWKVYKLSVADPGQKATVVHMTISVDDQVRQLTIQLPARQMAGRTVSQLVDFKVPPPRGKTKTKRT